MTSANGYPAYISFKDAAQLLVRRKLARSMTPQGLRYIARTRQKDWPFGDGGGKEPYLVAGNARLMRTDLLLCFFEKHPPIGRGPDRNPHGRKPGGVS
jgi:hypothetical protein